MRNIGDAWDYLTTPANWQGSEGIWTLLVQQLLSQLLGDPQFIAALQ